MKKSSFTRKERLKKNQAIKAVFDKGTRFRSKLVTVFLLKRNKDPGLNRVAFAVRKGLYNKKPSLRNRYRRVLREAYRKTKEFMPGGYDMIVLATNLTRQTKSTSLEQELIHVFKKCVKK
ncbi:MAG: ribonuclease P protein component [Candidatus Gorgyraea atricola]|nr:ribonuclease P protein component [Candidatus Gorgyraea atricola]